MTASQGLASLSSDLLTCIFSHVPPSPRLRVISSVCKRWRLAALRSIKSFAPTARLQKNLPRALEILPNVTSLEIRCKGFQASPSRIPASISSLVVSPPFDYDNACASPCVLSHFTRIPGLTSLAVFFSERCPHLAELLTNSQSSLTSLEILNGQFLPQLATLHFPRLVAFHASNTSGKDAVYPFISRHAAQLEELSLPVGRYWEPAFISIQYPKLRRLDIDRWGYPFLQTSPMQALLSSVPRTCDIRAIGFVPNIDAHKEHLNMDLLRNGVAHIEIPEEGDYAEKHLELLCACPRLSSLWLEIGDRNSTASLLGAPLSLRLTRLRLGLTTCDQSVLEVLSAITGLTHLTLTTRTSPMNTQVAHSISFPNLVELTTTAGPNFTLAIIRASPHLKSVTCIFSGSQVQLRMLLQEADERGVAYMDVRADLLVGVAMPALWMNYRVALMSDLPYLPVAGLL